MSGRGFAFLRRAGVRVTTGVLEGEARRLNERFVTAARLTRPFVLLKAAITLDGRIATAEGDARWITGPRERREARGLRRLHDGVLVGIGTVLADDPLLLPEPRTRRPFVRIVLDSRLRLPLTSRLAQSARRSPVLVLCGRRASRRRERALRAAGVLVLRTPTRAGRVALAPALRALRRRGIWSVMVEGGSETLGSFLHARAFDQLTLFRAPLLLGGRRSLSAFGGEDPARIADALRLERGAAPRGASYELWYPAGGRRSARKG